MPDGGNDERRGAPGGWIFARTLLKVVAWLVGIVLLLSLLMLLVINLPPVRDFIVRILEDELSDVMVEEEWRVEIGDLAPGLPFRVRFLDVRIAGPEGEEILTVSQVKAVPFLLPLLNMVLHLREVRLEGVVVALRVDEEGNLVVPTIRPPEPPEEPILDRYLIDRLVVGIERMTLDDHYRLLRASAEQSEIRARGVVFSDLEDWAKVGELSFDIDTATVYEEGTEGELLGSMQDFGLRLEDVRVEFGVGGEVDLAQLAVARLVGRAPGEDGAQPRGLLQEGRLTLNELDMVFSQVDPQEPVMAIELERLNLGSIEGSLELLKAGVGEQMAVAYESLLTAGPVDYGVRESVVFMREAHLRTEALEVREDPMRSGRPPTCALAGRRDDDVYPLIAAFDGYRADLGALSISFQEDLSVYLEWFASRLGQGSVVVGEQSIAVPPVETAVQGVTVSPYGIGVGLFTVEMLDSFLTMFGRVIRRDEPEPVPVVKWVRTRVEHLLEEMELAYDWSRLRRPSPFGRRHRPKGWSRPSPVVALYRLVTARQEAWEVPLQGEYGEVDDPPPGEQEVVMDGVGTRVLLGPELLQKIWQGFRPDARIDVLANVDGPLSNLEVSLTVVLPEGEVLVAGNLAVAEVDRLTYSLSVQVEGVDPSALVELEPLLRFDLDLDIRGSGVDPDDAQALLVLERGTVWLYGPALEVDLRAFRLALSQGVVTLERAEVATAGAELSAEGWVGIEAGSRFQLQTRLDVPDLARTVEESEPELKLEQQLEGDLALSAEITGRLPDPERDIPLQWEVAAFGEGGMVDLEDGLVRLQDISVVLLLDGEGELPPETAVLEIEVERASLADFVDLESISLEAGHDGELLEVALRSRLWSGEELRIALAGEILSPAAIRVADGGWDVAVNDQRWLQHGESVLGLVSPEVLVVDGLDLRREESRVALDLRVEGGDAQGDLKVEALELASLVKPLSPQMHLLQGGYLDGRVSFSSEPSPRGEVDLEITALELDRLVGLTTGLQAAYREGRLQVEGGVERYPEEFIRLSADLPISEGALQGEDWRGPGPIIADMNWSVRLETITSILGFTGEPDWLPPDLREGLVVEYHRETFDPEFLELVDPHGERHPLLGQISGGLSVRGDWREPQLVGAADLVNVEMLTRPTPLQGRLEFSSEGGLTAATFLMEGSWLTPGLDQEEQFFTFVNGWLQAETDLGEVIERGGLDEDAALDGNLTVIDLPLAPFLATIPLVRDPEGAFGLDASLGGTFGEPIVEGVLDLVNGRFYHETPGLVFYDMDMTASFTLPGELVVEQFTVRSWGGWLRMVGVVEFDTRFLPSAFYFFADLDQFGFSWQGVPIARLTAGVLGDLVMDFPPGRPPVVEGLIDVERGRVDVAQWFPDVQDLRPHEDFIVVSPLPPVPGPDEPLPPRGVAPLEFPNLAGNIDITLVDPVLIDSEEIFLSIVGDVSVELVPREIPILVGRVEAIRGRAAILGAAFDIVTGVILFTGEAPPDPQVEFNLAIDSPLGEVGIAIEGVVSDLVVSFISDPPMAEEDVARLIFLGRPQVGPVARPVPIMSGEEPGLVPAPLMDQLVLTAPGIISGFLISQIQSSLGLRFPFDIIEVAGLGTPETRVLLGKYLTPNLFLQYSYLPGAREDIRDSTNQVTLQYVISRRVIWETQVGDAGTGALRLVYIVQY